jgi:hypothetical protein
MSKVRRRIATKQEKDAPHRNSIFEVDEEIQIY